MMIKLCVLFLGNLRLVFRPQRRTAVNRFFAAFFAKIKDNRIINMVGIQAHNLPQINRIRILLFALFQKDCNFRAVTFFFGLADFKTADTVGRPAPGFILSGLARQNFNLVGDHKSRIKTHTELAD